jgi:hypothetical protein
MMACARSDFPVNPQHNHAMPYEASQHTIATPAPALWRWTVLIAISVAMFGTYYACDAIARRTMSS